MNVIDVENDKRKLLFNGVNCCLDEVSSELGEILSSGSPERLRGLPEEIIGHLAKRGYITLLDPEAEMSKFKEYVLSLHGRQSAAVSSGGIMLIPSYNCNLACSYCFQQEHRPANSGALMPLRLVDDIFEKHLPTLLPGVARPCLSIFGGEPFLSQNEPVLRRALGHVARRKGMSVVAVTNGTTVDAMPDIFGSALGKVNKVQISLDGAREQHDRSRVGSAGIPTYDKILKNIILLLERGTYIDIRLNIDAKKIASLPALMEELRSLGIAGNKQVSIRAYPLHESVAQVDSSDFISLAKLTREINNLGLELECPSTLRATDVKKLFRLTRGTAGQRTAYCMQTLQHYLIVDPFGDIYSCSEEAGYKEFRVGRINDSRVEFNSLRDMYKTRHIANLPDCLACTVALACGGQCGVKCRAKTGDLFKPCCDGIKEVILDGIKQGYSREVGTR